jgi:hypothetical protein
MTVTYSAYDISNYESPLEAKQNGALYPLPGFIGDKLTLDEIIQFASSVSDVFGLQPDIGIVKHEP